jgi:hypothetical protein
VDRVAVVEVLSARGAVVARVPVGRAFTVGRGYGCDVMLEDPFVEAVHLEVRLAPEGGFHVRDVGSVNPAAAGTLDLRGEGKTLASGETVRVGASRIRLVGAGAPVPPAVPMARERRRGPGWLAPVLAAAAVLALTVATWLGTPEAFDVADAASMATGLLLLFLGWSGAWALGTRVFTGSFRFLRHLGAAALTVLLVLPASAVVGVLAYALGPGAQILATALVALAAAAAAIFAQTRVASGASNRRLALTAGGIALALGFLLLGASLSDDDPTGAITTALLPVSPVPGSLIRAQPPQVLLDDVDDLIAELDGLDP